MSKPLLTYWRLVKRLIRELQRSSPPQLWYDRSCGWKINAETGPGDGDDIEDRTTWAIVAALSGGWVPFFGCTHEC